MGIAANLTASEEYRATRWVCAGSDVIARARKAAAMPVRRRFSAAGDVYELHLNEIKATANAFAFAWNPRECALIPPVQGLVVLRTIGPLLGITLRGSYLIKTNPADLLVHEALGKQSARRTLEYAVRAITAVLTDRGE